LDPVAQASSRGRKVGVGRRFAHWLGPVRWAAARALDRAFHWETWGGILMAMVVVSLLSGTFTSKGVGGLVLGLVGCALVALVVWRKVLGPALTRLRRGVFWLTHRHLVGWQPVRHLGDPLTLRDLSRRGLAWRLVLVRQSCTKGPPKGRNRRRDLRQSTRRTVAVESHDGREVALPAYGETNTQSFRLWERWVLELYKPHDPGAVCAVCIQVVPSG